MSWKVAGVWPDGVNAYVEPLFVAHESWLYVFGGFSWNDSTDAPNCYAFPIQADGKLGPPNVTVSPLRNSNVYGAVRNGIMYCPNSQDDVTGAISHAIKVFELRGGTVVRLPQFDAPIGSNLVASHDAKPAIIGDNLYVVAGAVSLFRLGADGSIADPPVALPTPATIGDVYPVLLAHQNWLYFIGGGSPDSAAIYRAETIPSTGKLKGGVNAWKLVAGLKAARSRFGATICGNTLVVAGGRTGSAGISSVETFVIGTDGNLTTGKGNISQLPGSQQWVQLTSQGSKAFAGLGYLGSGAFDPNIYVAKVNPDGQIF